MEEEALKKNTDCVYFLASPLTCKKGNECEFRHSESARLNPKDCWYWLGGKCLMPDCPFRHPPLDGRPATGVATSGPAHLGVAGGMKAKTPCFFFSQGYCAKGDKCPFQHGGVTTPAPGGQSTSGLGSKAPRATPLESSEANTNKKAENTRNNGSATVMMQTDTPISGNTSNAREARPAPSSAPKEIPQPVSKKDNRNSGSVLPNGTAKGRLEGAPTMSSAVAGASHKIRVRQLQSGDERHTGEGEEWWEESSPGFDVLVDVDPDQMCYDGAEFEGHEAELEHGRSGTASQRRGRQMYPADEFDEYDNNFMGGFNQAGFVAGGHYNHGSYEDYDRHGAHDSMRHPQDLSYGNRGRVEGFERGRERMVGNFEGDEGRTGVNHGWSQVSKRPRPDGHAQGKPSRRARTELGQDSFSNRRMQEDAQKSHELQLRHQLVAQQQGMGKSKSNSGRRTSDRLSSEVGRRSELVSTDRLGQYGDRGENEQDKVKREARQRSGDGERPWHRLENERRVQNLNSTSVTVENKPREAVAGVRQNENKLDGQSSFAGPKSLAQILAEKRKAAATQESVKSTDASVEIKRDNNMNIDHVLQETSSVEERKIKLDKVVGQEATKPVAFAGPKSLSDILQAKSKGDSETSSGDQAQGQVRHKEGVGVQADMDLSLSDNGGLAGLNTVVDKVEHHSDQLVKDSHKETRAVLGNGDEAQNPVLPDLDNSMDVEYSALEAQREAGDILLAGDMESAVDDVDTFGFDKKDSVEAEDDDAFSLDDDEDDFAKKLGGFFS